MDCEGQRLSPVPPSGAAEELIKVSSLPLAVPSSSSPLSKSHHHQQQQQQEQQNDFFFSSASSSSTLLRGVVVKTKRPNPLTNIPSFMEIEHTPKRRRLGQPCEDEQQQQQQQETIPSFTRRLDAPAAAVAPPSNGSSNSNLLLLKRHESTTTTRSAGNISTSTCHRPDPPAEHADLASALASVNLASPQQKKTSTRHHRHKKRQNKDESDTSSLSSVETNDPETTTRREGSSNVEEEEEEGFYKGLAQWAMYTQQQQQEGMTLDHFSNHHSSSGSSINHWIETIREKYRLQRLPEEHMAILNAMGFVWEPTTNKRVDMNTSEEEFHARLLQLAEYKNSSRNNNNNSFDNVSVNYRDQQGLVQWIDAVRMEFRHYQATGMFSSNSILNHNRLSLLQAIGLPFHHTIHNDDNDERMNPPTTRTDPSSERHKRLRRTNDDDDDDHTYQSE